MKIQKLMVSVCCALTLSACQGLPSFMGASHPKDPQAEALLATHDYQSAMRRFQYLAQTQGDPDHYWLLAADAALRGGDGASAQNMAYNIRASELDRDDRSHYLLLTSRLDLNAGRARDAIGKLDAIDATHLDRSDRVNYHTLRASALNQLGDMLGSARERVALGALLTQHDSVESNNEALFDALKRVPDTSLARRDPPPDTLSGWMSLVQILRATPASDLNGAVDQWRQRYPSHPASSSAFLKAALAKSPAPRKPQPAPNKSDLPKGPFMGVLLPLSGPYAGVAQSIRTGLTLAYQADGNADKPQLVYEDTADGNITQRYRRLAEGGASLVLGPLVKEEVAELASNPDLTVPVLALNQVPSAKNPKVIQFALTPEQEIEQIAGSAWLDGHQTALMLTPDTAFGQRLAKHFEHYWKTLGGRIEKSGTYTAHGSDPGVLVNELKPTPSSGNAFVFMMADPTDARAILPKMTALQLPVYATSHVFDSHSGHSELNGVVLCDMPWLLNPNEGGALSLRALDSQFPRATPDTLKLIAMGLDAYRMATELPRFKADPDYRFNGASGSLSLQSGIRLQRQLECAQFVGAHPKPRGPAPVLPAVTRPSPTTP